MQNNNSAFDLSLNLNVRGMPLSATLRINELSNKLKLQGKNVYKFGLGQSPFPVPKVVVDELRSNAFQKDYLEVTGLKALRRSVAEYHSKRNGVQYNEDNVLIGPGSKELMFLLQFVYYGELVIQTPSWVSYAPQAKIIGRQIAWIKTKEENKWRLLPEELYNICNHDQYKPRIVILNYPSNPTGVTYSCDELQELADVARKHRVILLSDEIYGGLTFSGNHCSIARFYPEGTIVSGGLSKWCGAGGWRLGTFTFPESLSGLLSGMATVASETFTSTSAPIQYAAIKAFTEEIAIEIYLLNARKILKTLGIQIHKILHDADIKSPSPDGAFYLFINFKNFSEKLKARNILTSLDLTTRLLEETGVALLPGSAFGRPEKEYTARLSYVDFDGAGAMAAAEAIRPEDHLPEGFINTYCSHQMEGIQAIVGWVKSL